MNNEFLKKNFSELSDEALLSIVNENSKDYTNEALEIAKEEIKNRSLVAAIKDEDIVERKGKTEKHYVPINIISLVIKISGGLVIIAGIVRGLISMNSFSKLTGVETIIAGVISGFVFFGLGEIINLLHQINERQKVR